MLRLCLDNVREYDITIGEAPDDLTVVIQPLTRKEELELERKFTKSKLKFQTSGRKQKGSTIIPADIDNYELNIATAKRTWKSWDLEDQDGNAVPCNEANVGMIFLNHYDEVALPVLNELDKKRSPELEDDAEDFEESEKN